MMKNITSVFILILLCIGCNEEAITPSTDPSLSLRDHIDCTDFCNLSASEKASCCDDFSDCSDLATGNRPISFTLGAPPITLTGQKPEGTDINAIGLCSNPAAGHPFSFRFYGTVDGSAAVRTRKYMGRLQKVEFDACVRPYLEPGFAPVPPFLQPIPFELYPPCNDLEADYVVTAANGDEIWFHLEADGFPNCDNPELYSLVGGWRITGGTGRFEDATGGGCATGSGWANPFDPNPGAADIWVLEGMIDF